jgi:two-component sensor histidine kinase
MIGSDKAVSMGLIVTELVINAVKYAFGAPKADARILVYYEINDADWRLTVSDNGGGKAKAGIAKGATGLGTTLVKALAKQLDARMDVVDSDGGFTVAVTRASFASRIPHGG